MADKATIDGVGASVDEPVKPSAGSSEKVWSIPGSFDYGREKLSITRIFIDGSLFIPERYIRLKEGSLLQFEGSGLNTFQSAKFSASKNVLKEDGSNDSIISFVVPDLSGEVKDGGSVWLRLFNRSASVIIAPYAIYSYKDDKAENKTSDKKSTGEGGSTGQNNQGKKESTLIADTLINPTLSGIVGAIAEGFSGSKPSTVAANTASQNSGSSSTPNQNAVAKDDYYDADVDSSEQQTASVSSTTDTAGGAQTISSGGTVEQSVTSQTSGGTVSGTQTATVSGTVSGSQSGTISGTAITGGRASVSGTVSGGASVSGGSTVSGQVNIAQSGTVGGGGGASIEATTQSQGSVSAQGQPSASSGSQVGGQASGTANLNQTVSGGAQGTAGSGGATISQGGTAARGVNFGAPSGASAASTGQGSTTQPAAQNQAQQNKTSGQSAGSVGAALQQSAQASASASGSQPKTPSSGSAQSPSEKPSPSTPSSSAQNPTLPGKGKVDGIGLLDDDNLPPAAPAAIPQAPKGVQDMIGKLADNTKALGGLGLPTAPIHGADPGGAPGAANEISTASNLGRNAGNNVGENSEGQGNSSGGKSPQEPASSTQDKKPGTASEIQSSGGGSGKKPPSGRESSNQDNPDQPEEENSPFTPNTPNQNTKKPPSSALDSLTDNPLAKEAIGEFTGQAWWWGFGIAAAVLFSGLDFFAGAIIMDVYWIFFHRKQPRLFPLKGWQKLVTVLANLLPFVWASVFFGIVLYLGCNTGVLKLAGYSDVCQSFMGLPAGLSGALNGAVSGNPPPVSYGTGTCVAPLSGDASIAYMSNTCFGAVAAPTAAVIAAHESGGNPTIPSGVDICHDANGNKVMVTNSSGQQVAAAVSFGLFQINITSHQIGSLNCPAAFSYPPTVTVKEYDANNHQCSIIDPTLYNNCVQAAEDPAQNINQACVISKNGTNWNAWKADINACGISSSN